ncbi:MAG: hypothetical protein ACLFWF_15165, partial [Alphaproteobacteria bacterium]
LAAVRDQGILDLETVEAVVLETDGSFTTMSQPPPGKPAEASALQSVSAAMEAKERPGAHPAS